MFIRYPYHIRFVKTSKDCLLFNLVNNDSLRFSDGIEYDFLKLVQDEYINLESIIDNLSIEYQIEKDIILNDFKDFCKALSIKGFLDIHFISYPKNLIIELTKQCNEKCRHCYLPNEKKSYVSNLKIETIQKILNEFKKYGGDNLILTGGEVFLYKHFFEVLSYASQLNLNITIKSNITKLNEKNINNFKINKIKQVDTSIYGSTALIHDKITKLKGSFIRTINNAKSLKKEGINVKFSLVLMRSNKDDFISIIKLLKQENFDFSVETIITSDVFSCNGINPERLTLEEFKKTMIEFKEYDSESFIKNVKIKSKDLYMENPLSFLNDSCCEAGVESLYVNSDAEFSGCPLLSNITFGRYYDKSFKDILKNKNLINLINIKNSNFSQCLKCEAFDYCKVCVGLNYVSTGKLTEISQHWCDQAFIIKELAEECK